MQAVLWYDVWDWPLTCVGRDSPAAAHCVRWQGAVPGGEGAGDGGGAGSTECKCFHHLCGSWQPQLAGKWSRMFFVLLFFFYFYIGQHKVLLSAHVVLQDSILDIKVPIFKGPGEMPEIRSYMDEFPFPFYVILRDVNALPETLSDALRQWFELVTAADQWTNEKPSFTGMGGVGSSQLHN